MNGLARDRRLRASKLGLLALFFAAISGCTASPERMSDELVPKASSRASDLNQTTNQSANQSVFAPRSPIEKQVDAVLRGQSLMNAVSKRYPAEWLQLVRSLSRVYQGGNATQSATQLVDKQIGEFRAQLAPRLRRLTQNMPDNLLAEFFAVKADTYLFHAQLAPRQCEGGLMGGSNGRRKMQSMFEHLPEALRRRHIEVMARIVEQSPPEFAGAPESIAQGPARQQVLASDQQALRRLEISEPVARNGCAALAARIRLIAKLPADQSTRIYRSMLPRQMSAVYATPARVRLLPESGSILITGRIGAGTVERFAQFLAGEQPVKTVLLRSHGGLLSEADGLANLIAKHRLDTRVEEDCSSACTIVFLAGARRLARKTAMIGFHQASTGGDAAQPSYLYRTVNDYRRLYRIRTISDDFLRRVAATPSVEVWFPSWSELTRNGIVTEQVGGTETKPEKLAYQSVDSMARALLGSGPFRAFASRFPTEWNEELARLEVLRMRGASKHRLHQVISLKVYGRFQTLRPQASDELVADASRFVYRRLTRSRRWGDVLHPSDCSMRILVPSSGHLSAGAAEREHDGAGLIIERVLTFAKNADIRPVGFLTRDAQLGVTWAGVRAAMSDMQWNAAWRQAPENSNDDLAMVCQSRALLLKLAMGLSGDGRRQAALRQLWNQRL